MALRKRDTSAGFRPVLPRGDDVRAASRDALRMDGRLDESVLGPSIHQLLLSMARIRNVVSTLRIEGERIDLEGARHALESGKPATATEEQVIRLAKEYTLLHETRPSQLPEFTIESVLGLHRRLFDGIYPEANPGRLKTAQNGLVDGASGRLVFEATPPARTRQELERLFEWWSSQRDTAPAASVAAVFFAEFEAIHPFHDGNGRVGRLVGAAALKKLGCENIGLVPLDGRFYRTHEQYYEKLATTNAARNYVPWARYFGAQVVKAYETSIRRSDLKPVLERQTRPATRGLLEWVLARDASPFAFGDYPNPKGYSRESIQKSLGQLVEQRILEPMGERRGRRYKIGTDFLRRVYGGDFE